MLDRARRVRINVRVVERGDPEATLDHLLHRQRAEPPAARGRYAFVLFPVPRPADLHRRSVDRKIVRHEAEVQEHRHRAGHVGRQIHEQVQSGTRFVVLEMNGDLLANRFSVESRRAIFNDFEAHRLGTRRRSAVLVLFEEFMKFRAALLPGVCVRDAHAGVGRERIRQRVGGDLRLGVVDRDARNFLVGIIGKLGRRRRRPDSADEEHAGTMNALSHGRQLLRGKDFYGTQQARSLGLARRASECRRRFCQDAILWCGRAVAGNPVCPLVCDADFEAIRARAEGGGGT